MSRLEFIKAWTDYPIAALGDREGIKAPVRPCFVKSYDGDKYCVIEVAGHREMVKRGYVYYREGRYGEVPWISRRRLTKLPRTDYSAPLNNLEQP